MKLTDSPWFAVGMMLAGLAAGTVWYGLRLKKRRMPVRAALLAAAAGSLLALICAKAAFLLHDLGSNLFEGYFDELISLRPDTLSFAGGCLGFVAGVALAARMSGIRPALALDLFAAPGCVFLCLARIAEGGMDNIGTGSEVTAEWMQFFPLTMQNNWGDAYLSVFVLEALTALACLIPACRTAGPGGRDGDVIRRTAVCMIGAQIGWEMLLQYPYIRSLVTSFVSLDQVIWAVVLMVLVVRGCLRNKKWWPIAATTALLGISAIFQFMRDKPYLFTEPMSEKAGDWLMENAETVAIVAFFLISAALIPVGLKALSPGKKSKK